MNNIEFGSDYHTYKSLGYKKISLYADSVLYGSGRNVLFSILSYYLKNKKWLRLWIPTYYCGSVIETIIKSGIQIIFYKDNPLINDVSIINNLKFEEGDVILRVNYFGLRGFRDNSKIEIPVIEDHSHAIFSDWAKTSNADWCFGSLRKELPLPDGGILWSPKLLKNKFLPMNNNAYNSIIKIRNVAMNLKQLYLFEDKYKLCKDSFLQLFLETEKLIELNDTKRNKISIISQQILDSITEEWITKKENNYKLIIKSISSYVKVFISKEVNFPFSIILLFKDKSERDFIKLKLCKNNIYPAVLWPVNKWMTLEDRNFSERMISLHCDGRYSNSDIKLLTNKIKEILINNDKKD